MRSCDDYLTRQADGDHSQHAPPQKTLQKGLGSSLRLVVGCLIVHHIFASGRDITKTSMLINQGLISEALTQLTGTGCCPITRFMFSIRTVHGGVFQSLLIQWL